MFELIVEDPSKAGVKKIEFADSRQLSVFLKSILRPNPRMFEIVIT